MKKIFLFAIIIAGAATSFAQNATPKKSLIKQNGAKSYREAQMAKQKQEPVKTVPVEAKATTTSTSAPAKAK